MSDAEAADRKHALIVIIPFYNEGAKILRVLQRIRALGDHRSFDVLLVNDGSTEALPQLQAGEQLLSHPARQGVGAAIRSGIKYASAEEYEFVAVMAGNDKDNPAEIADLFQCMVRQKLDLIQGSRYLLPGDLGAMPYYRRIATRLFSLIFSAVAGKRMTDATNGFRIMRSTFLKDPGLQLDQSWLDQYELEPYLLYKAIYLGYAVQEGACSKRYPSRREGQTKMHPFTGWWSIMRPLFLLRLGIRR